MVSVKVIMINQFIFMCLPLVSKQGLEVQTVKEYSDVYRASRKTILIGSAHITRQTFVIGTTNGA